MLSKYGNKSIQKSLIFSSKANYARCLFFLFFCFHLHADVQYPADISYMVADLKYSKESGVKICEVQQGSLSALLGDLYISGGDGILSPKIADFFARFPMKKWAVGIGFRPLIQSFAARGWITNKSLRAISNDPEFLEQAKMHPAEVTDISSYSGILYCSKNYIENDQEFRIKHPGILLMDALTFPYWIDKYKMSELFNRNPLLSTFKPKWGLYSKDYTPNLAIKIQEEIAGDLYVIKPRGEFLGKGVIIVAKEDLDRTLQLILLPTKDLILHPDQSYAYWWGNHDDTFIVEKYYASDPLQLPKKLEGKDGRSLAGHTENEEKLTYDPTMRIVFILMYDKGQASCHCFGGFWKHPSKALEEEGTLNEKRKSRGKPFYAPVADDLLQEVMMELETGMLLLYQEMLEG